MNDILVIGASTDERILAAGRAAGERWPGAHLSVLLPHGCSLSCPASFRVIEAASDTLGPDDLRGVDPCDAVVLTLSHVGRNNYPEFVRHCTVLAKQCFLFSSLGWQRLDSRDAESCWPEIIPSAKRFSPSTQPRSWVFFRPSDRTAHHIASSFQKKGLAVLKVETLAELEAVIPQTDAVFFDWCVTHYGALFHAVQMALEHGKRMEALISLDMADLAERPEVSQRLIEFNRSALPLMDHIHYLASRKFILERYAIDVTSATPWWNQANPDHWRIPGSHPARRESNSPVHIVYHGLFYPWHEVAEFIPVLEALLSRRPVCFDLFGRIHESLSIAGESLFPEKERQIREAVRRMERIPGVVFHPFSSPTMIREAMASADYYLGITQGATLMSETEIRTGEEEARLAGLRLLRKATSASILRGWNEKDDFLEINADDPDAAADKICASLG